VGPDSDRSGDHDRETCIPIGSDADIVRARQLGRELAAQAGCSPTDLTMVATAISEIARNIVTYATRGEMEMRLIDQDGRRKLMIVATDEGPGILDIDKALQDGYSTGQGLGLGLPGTRRLVDEFDITSEPGRGTKVVMYKWCGRSR
jgi:anti-sigma regulatory factor (Ser/Thr protein kinase)